jgi:glucokinase
VYLRARKHLEPAMRAALAAEALPESVASCRIVPAELGEDIGNYGAIAAARYHLESRQVRTSA